MKISKLAMMGTTALLACALMACEKETPKPQTDPVAPPSTVTTTATAAPGTRTAETIADSDLSTPAGFESEAEGSITSKNYKAELTSLESEVTKE